MSPLAREILESLPLPKEEFIRRHGEQILTGMTLANAVVVSNDVVEIGARGKARLDAVQSGE
jgi:hypothetical protein